MPIFASFFDVAIRSQRTCACCYRLMEGQEDRYQNCRKGKSKLAVDSRNKTYNLPLVRGDSFTPIFA